jgi:hypothetical protein
MAYRVIKAQKEDYFTRRLYTVAGAAHCMQSTITALCFPFNRKHEHVCEHQNNVILKARRAYGKMYCN